MIGPIVYSKHFIPKGGTSADRTLARTVFI